MSVDRFDPSVAQLPAPVGWRLERRPRGWKAAASGVGWKSGLVLRAARGEGGGGPNEFGLSGGPASRSWTWGPRRQSAAGGALLGGGNGSWRIRTRDWREVGSLAHVRSEGGDNGRRSLIRRAFNAL